MTSRNPNSGHGHVRPRPDGVKHLPVPEFRWTADDQVVGS